MEFARSVYEVKEVNYNYEDSLLISLGSSSDAPEYIEYKNNIYMLDEVQRKYGINLALYDLYRKK